jgi:hypothetical protein
VVKRIPTVWFRFYTKTWYVKIDGKQIPVGRTEEEAVANRDKILRSLPDYG